MTIISSQSLGDRNGFYQVGNRKTYLKTELMDWLHHMPTSWHWNYNDEFFGQFDWRVEPTENINELYRQRALELRRNYDYIVLYYSGGHDSSNALYAFLDNDIPLDEICVYYSKYDTVSNQYKELQGLTWNKVKWLQAKYPNQRFRFIDYGDMFKDWHDIIKGYGYKDDLFDVFGSMLSINRIIADEFYMTIPEWHSMIESGKRFAWLFGADKPMVRYLDGAWIFNFHDAFVQCRMTPLRQLYDDGTRGSYEYFYWSPTDACQQIIRKQCHLLANTYNEQAQIDFSKISGAKPHNPSYGWEVDTMTPSFVNAIYPRLFEYGETYFIEKNAKYIFGNRDQWFFDSNHDGAQRHYDMYRSLNSNLYSHYHDWMNDGANIENGLKNCLSQNYVFLENPKLQEQPSAKLHSGII